MEDRYWNRFTSTGRVEDYLNFKGISAYPKPMNQNEDKHSESVKHSNRNDTVGSTDRRI